MDHMPKEDTEEMIKSWSKECLFSHREVVVDKENLYCFFVSWSAQDINKVFYIFRSFCCLGSISIFKRKLKGKLKEKSVNFFGVGTNTEEALLVMPETADDIQGRELLISTEKKGKAL